MSRQLISTVASPFQKGWGTPAILTGAFVSIGTTVVFGLILSAVRAIALLPLVMAISIIIIGAFFTLARFGWAKAFEERAEAFKSNASWWMIMSVLVGAVTLLTGLIFVAIGSNIVTINSQGCFWLGFIGTISYAACIAVLNWSAVGGARRVIIAAVLAFGSQLMPFALAAQQAWLDAGHFMN